MRGDITQLLRAEAEIRRPASFSMVVAERIAAFAYAAGRGPDHHRHAFRAHIACKREFERGEAAIGDLIASRVRASAARTERNRTNRYRPTIRQLRNTSHRVRIGRKQIATRGSCVFAQRAQHGKFMDVDGGFHSTGSRRCPIYDCANPNCRTEARWRFGSRTNGLD